MGQMQAGRTVYIGHVGWRGCGVLYESITRVFRFTKIPFLFDIHLELQNLHLEEMKVNTKNSPAEESTRDLPLLYRQPTVTDI